VPDVDHSVVLSRKKEQPEDVSPPGYGWIQLLLVAEAIAAIDRTVIMGFKGNLACLTASGANGVIHLTFGAFATSVLASLTAGLTTLGFVGETLFSIKFLLTGGESEFLSAILADQSLVFVHWGKPLFRIPQRLSVATGSLYPISIKKSILSTFLKHFSTHFCRFYSSC
jgi:hypothetical protein